MKKKSEPKLSAKKQIEIDILCKSLIGREVEIVESTNPRTLGLRGVLVYESAKLFYVQVDDKVKRVLKNTVTISTVYNNQRVRVKGDALLGTLVTRIKKIK